MLTACEHLRAQETTHHDHGERVHVGRFGQLLIARLVYLALAWVQALHVVNENGNVVSLCLPASFILDRLTQCLVFLVRSLPPKVESEGRGLVVLFAH